MMGSQSEGRWRSRHRVARGCVCALARAASVHGNPASPLGAVITRSRECPRWTVTSTGSAGHERRCPPRSAPPTFSGILPRRHSPPLITPTRNGWDVRVAGPNLCRFVVCLRHRSSLVRGSESAGTAQLINAGDQMPVPPAAGCNTGLLVTQSPICSRQRNATCLGRKGRIDSNIP